MKQLPRRIRQQWILDSFQDEPSFFHKAMFGCRACYAHGQLKLVIAPSPDEPWKGVLVCTSRESHDSLRKEFPPLEPHPVLGKWLYIPEDSEEFVETVTRLVELAIAGDARIGVEPGKRGRGKSKSKEG